MQLRLFVLLTYATFYFTLSTSQAAEPVAHLEAGRSVAFDRSQGNCLACHAIPNDPAVKSPGNIGPPLFSIKTRYPDRAKLRAQIWDATANNPQTAMPPFGKNKILSDADIDLLIDYLYSI
jgi:L-cysteine S-thiosulfotransferase